MPPQARVGAAHPVTSLVAAAVAAVAAAAVGRVGLRMTEFWVSRSKFWCEYCKVWLDDSKNARARHEDGERHKAAVAQRVGP